MSQPVASLPEATMEYVVRIAARIDGPFADALARGVLAELSAADVYADMAEGANGVYAFWTTVVAETVEAGIASGTGRVREAIRQALRRPGTAQWPRHVRALNIEAYPADESADLALL